MSVQTQKRIFKKYLNSATELPSDSVAQLVGAWQAICQVTGSRPFLSHCLFFSLFLVFFFFQWLWPGYGLTVRSGAVNNQACTSRFAVLPPNHRTRQLVIRFGWIPGSSALSTWTQPLECQVTRQLSLFKPFARSQVRVPPWVTVSFSVFISHLSLSMTLTRLWSDCQVWSC